MLTEETIRLPSGRSWRVFGGGEGRQILWLHGPHGVDPADPFVAALAARHRVIAPLAPGFTDLDELAEIDTIHELVLDYDDLLRHMKLASLPIVGHSFGAMMAAELAAHFPDRAQRLVLVAPVGLWNDAYPVADLFAVPGIEMDQLLWRDDAARAAHAERLKELASALDEAEQIIAVTRSLTALTKFIWPIPDKGLRKRLRRITAPTLALFGADDAFVPARYAADFGKGIAGAETQVVAGAGHMLPYEKTAQLADGITRFLARN
ncbi:MAG TPA: alpha/beta hydrolase [Stellaceae bacterium]|nr:alpha/beta hydrolase [Stellaceae bacterium]